ncbi:YbhB/YbcL family Raf kinase inhibitor-like protein [Mycolicibacterium mucogenicum]|uniref:YbhB/YbcL family Raf kinase inhibitor-like protein n=1 Tax=Mycolicibacterium mucogenicum TaxID=56689 RepID=UPI000ACF79D1|nr:YbhB/YbcL family Raf kinase inhibitor-like protein [Mycolicibacterium mucogenicum]KAB7754130.1 phosphatidylethanolamine-binding protein [Mycolicibacterium mucogenicum DSM 44124]
MMPIAKRHGPHAIAAIGRVLRPMRADPARSPLVGQGFTAPQTITVSSPEFADGAPMPLACAGPGVGHNRSPELQWAGVPAESRQLVLVLDDVDVPLPTPLIHSIAVLEPNVSGLAAGAFTADQVRVIPTVLSKTGYSGPRPIPGHGPHRYRFHLLALDCPLPADINSAKHLIAAAAHHVLARGILTGSYER